MFRCKKKITKVGMFAKKAAAVTATAPATAAAAAAAKKGRL